MAISTRVHSVLGIGFGPANLSLAVALEELGFTGDAHFIERARAFQWQDEQLLPGTDIQNNPFRDLAMPRTPDSPHTFVKYLASRGQLTEFLHLNLKFPVRREYAGYLAWVADAFRDSVDYGQMAASAAVVEDEGGPLFEVETEGGRRYRGKALAFGTGRSPRVPVEFQHRLGPTIFHATNYRSSMERLRERDIRVVVVGASQSAIEIVLDLLGRPNVRQVTSLQRGIGFRLKDTSPYTRRQFLPEFVDYFYPLPSETKRRIRAQLRLSNYASCDHDVIDQLARTQYEYELTGSDRFRLVPFSEVVEVAARGAGHRLSVRDVNNGRPSSLETDVVVLATGFRDIGVGLEDEIRHPLLDGIEDRLAVDAEGLPAVNRDYSVEVSARIEGMPPLRLYLNGLCEASHGMGDSGALAVLSARATDIAESIIRHRRVLTGGRRGRAVAAEALQ